MPDFDTATPVTNPGAGHKIMVTDAGSNALYIAGDWFAGVAWVNAQLAALPGAMTGAEIAVAYEGEDDRNAFTDAEKAKLATAPADIASDLATRATYTYVDQSIEDAVFDAGGGTLAGPSEETVSNTTGDELYAGTFVEPLGFDATPGIEAMTVVEADAASGIPGVGLIKADIPPGGVGRVVRFGAVDANTNGMPSRALVYAASGGGLSTTVPVSGFAQVAGIVLQGETTTGKILAMPGPLSLPAGEGVQIMARDDDPILELGEAAGATTSHLKVIPGDASNPTTLEIQSAGNADLDIVPAGDGILRVNGAPVGSGSSPLAVRAEIGTAFTFADGDERRPYVSHENAAASVATVPSHASDAITVGSRIRLVQQGSGVVTISAENPAMIMTAGLGLSTAGAGSVVDLHKIDNDEWVATGDLTVGGDPDPGPDPDPDPDATNLVSLTPNSWALATGWSTVSGNVEIAYDGNNTLNIDLFLRGTRETGGGLVTPTGDEILIENGDQIEATIRIKDVVTPGSHTVRMIVQRFDSSGSGAGATYTAPDSGLRDISSIVEGDGVSDTFTVQAVISDEYGARLTWDTSVNGGAVEYTLYDIAVRKV